MSHSNRRHGFVIAAALVGAVAIQVAGCGSSSSDQPPPRERETTRGPRRGCSTGATRL